MSGRNGKLDAITANLLYRAAVENSVRSLPWLRGGATEPDPRRDINDECGLPETPGIRVQDYQMLYDREAVARRAVNVRPTESWKVSPTVYEDEDPDNETEFERAWDQLGKDLRGQGWYRSEAGSAVWDYLLRADVLCGIGRYGVVLMGLDDVKEGESLLKPADGIDEGGERTKATQKKLNFLRVFPESLATVGAWETRVGSPRYGLPTMYRLTLNDPNTFLSGGANQTGQTVDVHWTRCIHVADNLESSEVLGTPRLQPIYNNVYGLRKIYNAAPEGYWKGALPSTILSTHPQLGGDVEIDVDALRDMIEEEQNSQQKWMILRGMAASTLSRSMQDPTAQIKAQLEAICIVIDVPMRIFLGSERGELASSQDQDAWDWRMYDRFVKFCTPRIICPFVDRLIVLGALPEPSEYHVYREKPGALNAMDRATVAASRVDAMAKYVSGNVEAIMTPMDFLTRELGYEEDEATEILDAANGAIEEKQAAAAQAAQPDPSLQRGFQEISQQAGGQQTPSPGEEVGSPKPPFPQGGEATTNTFNPKQARDAKGKWTEVGAAQLATQLANAPKATQQAALQAMGLKTPTEMVMKWDSITSEQITGALKTLGGGASASSPSPVPSPAKTVAAPAKVTPPKPVAWKVPDGVKGAVSSILGDKADAVGSLNGGGKTSVDSVAGGKIRINSEHVEGGKPVAWWQSTLSKSGGKVTMNLDHADVDPSAQGRGLGTKILGKQIDAARAAGVSEITLVAARSQNYNGYYTWARLGFDGPLSNRWLEDNAKSLKGSLKKATKVSDLMKTPKGRALWKDKGGGIELSMPLDKSSKGLKVFEAYRKEKGL